MRRLIILSLLLFTAAANAAVLKPCESDTKLRCGTLEVFENRATKRGRKIGIKVLVIPATNPTPAADPMFALTGGGPGVASIPEAKSWAGNFPEIAATRDIVFFDQRGTGESNALDCPVGDSAAAIRSFLGGELSADLVRACRDELAKRADLKSYTTAAAADDMDDIRRWLGYERINIYGSSYTSRLAMVYAQRYPKRVRTVTMKAVTPFALRNPLYAADASQAALDRLFADCAAEPACREKYPDLRAQFERVLARLEASPGELTRNVFAGVIRRMLYSADAQRALPFAIASAAREDYTPLKPVLGAGEAIDRVLNVGLFLSVTCAEDVARYTEAEAIDAARGTFSGPVLATALLRACAQWPVAPLRHRIETKSKVDALIISGALDPDTPPRWGNEMNRLFPRAKHVVVEGMAHSGSPQCVRDLVTKFVLAGSMKNVDAKCDVKRPPFVIR